MFRVKERSTKAINWREIISYLIAGVLTTGVNFVVYHLLVYSYGIEHWFVLNTIAIVVSIIFAYIINRRYVFLSSEPWLPEVIKFFLSRGLVSLIFEQGGMYLLLDILSFNPVSIICGLELYWSKVLVQFFVVVGNYIVSKLLVFKRGKE